MEEPVEKTDAHSGSRSPNWYIVGLSLVGVAVGYFAGLSKTPVVNTLLPLLFGLTGGAGGLYLAKADLTKIETAYRLKVLGKTLAIFSLATVIAATYGMLVRTGQPLSVLVSWERTNQPQHYTFPKFQSFNDGLELITWRLRIQALGATPDELSSLLWLYKPATDENDAKRRNRLWSNAEEIIGLTRGNRPERPALAKPPPQEGGTGMAE